MKFGLMLLWGALVAVLGLASLVPVTTGAAGAAAVENLMVPSAAMGRDIPVTFMAGGPQRFTCSTLSMRETP
jgi:S-formylglutathione hydrolase FrmB